MYVEGGGNHPRKGQPRSLEGPMHLEEGRRRCCRWLEHQGCEGARLGPEGPDGHSWGQVSASSDQRAELFHTSPLMPFQEPCLEQAAAPLPPVQPRDVCPRALRDFWLFDNWLLGSRSESVPAVAPLTST